MFGLQLHAHTPRLRNNSVVGCKNLANKKFLRRLLPNRHQDFGRQKTAQEKLLQGLHSTHI